MMGRVELIRRRAALVVAIGEAVGRGVEDRQGFIRAARDELPDATEAEIAAAAHDVVDRLHDYAAAISLGEEIRQ